MGLPLKRMDPESAARMFMIILIIVDLPAPLGPRSPKISPFLVEKETLSTACTRPKLLLTERNSITGTVRSLQAYVGKQAVKLQPDDLVALAYTRLQARSIQHGDASPGVGDQPGPLELSRGFGDAFAPHTQHIGDQFLGHVEV